jgi:asparagine synthase (glutamine-hydrolysing)
LCGIAGIVGAGGRSGQPMPREVALMNRLIGHRGPDASGVWIDPRGRCALGHRRLSIIDLSEAAAQPMHAPDGRVIVYNGEIYNYIELRDELAASWTFRTSSDTEVVLAAHAAWGEACLDRLRGMFAFLIFDQRTGAAFAARDRLGIKPFYHAEVDGRMVFASEIKAILPFLPDVDIDVRGLQQYLTFQFTIGDATMFKGVAALAPGHCLTRSPDGRVSIRRYWDVTFEADVDHSTRYFERRVGELIDESIRLHLRADVPVGSYLSGGVDSSLVAILAKRHDSANANAFHGKFIDHPGYDESAYARTAAAASGSNLHEGVFTAQDFIDNIGKIVWHMDQPAAGPGSFPQYMVSQLAAKHNKVVLGGQGGDEIFAGYARYLIAYFEQCLKGAIDGTAQAGRFVVTAETIIPNLSTLREYKPMMAGFWKQGLFESHDRRYFQLINRFADLSDEIEPEFADNSQAFEDFAAIFNNRSNVHNRAYLDQMLHFDLKTLLPALLHVEDRMSMAHGLESRVPFVDHPLIEFLATTPASIKFKDGRMKHLLKSVFGNVLPPEILNRRDKMGFPVPLSEWYEGPLREFLNDTLGSMPARTRSILRPESVRRSAGGERKFSRKTWGLLNLELWMQAFLDRAHELRAMLAQQPEPAAAE